MSKKLTAKEARFVDEFVIDLNMTKAAERAGYSKKSARSIGSENLTKPHIQEAIQERLAKRSEACGITAQQVITELALIAFSDLGDIMSIGDDDGTFQFKPGSEWPEKARRAVASIKIKRDLGTDDRPPTETVEIKLWDKVDALRQLAEHLGLVKELQELLDRVAAMENAKDDSNTDPGSGKARPGN